MFYYGPPVEPNEKEQAEKEVEEGFDPTEDEKEEETEFEEDDEL